MRFLRQLFARKQSSQPRKPSSFRPRLEALESREVPTVSSISSVFNARALPANSSMWFSSVGNVSGLGREPVTIRITEATITSDRFSVAVPDAVITFSREFTTASTSFNEQTNTWVTQVPRAGFDGNVFFAGASIPVPEGLRGRVRPVIWQANFTTDTPGVRVNWSWEASVFRQFSTDNDALGVKPIDGRRANPYRNNDPAGTPENYRRFELSDLRGGADSNTRRVRPDLYQPEPEPEPEPPGLSSLSGFVFVDLDMSDSKDDGEPGIGGVTITLEGIDDLGQSVFLTTTTGDDGSYSFANLRAGTYRLTQTQPDEYADGWDTLGSLGGVHGNDQFSEIVVGEGVSGTDYNFGEYEFLPS